MNDDLIRKIQDIFINWNPLGEKSKSINDLDDYYTEVVDILFELNNKSTKPKIQKTIQDILNEAFDLSLSFDECNESALLVGKAIIEIGLD